MICLKKKKSLTFFSLYCNKYATEKYVWKQMTFDSTKEIHLEKLFLPLSAAGLGWDWEVSTARCSSFTNSTTRHGLRPMECVFVWVCVHGVFSVSRGGSEWQWGGEALRDCWTFHNYKQTITNISKSLSQLVQPGASFQRKPEIFLCAINLKLH